MKFTKYIKDKINYILGFIVYSIIVLAYANAMAVNKNFIIIITIISFLFLGVGLLISYLRKNKYIKNIENIMDGLEEKYLISEIIKKPKKQENLVYYNIFKRANKSMLENINKINNSSKDFKEYIGKHPECSIVEMDTVEGIKGGKVLLTIHFVNCSFMLVFLRDYNDAQSVIDIFN